MAHTTPAIQFDTLVYSQDGQGYLLEVGTPAWYEWLNTVTTFAYQSEQGSFTARKEQAGNRRGGWYWKAYRKREGKLYRAYLGKSEELTLERLCKVAESLMGDVKVTQTSGERKVGSGRVGANLALPEPHEYHNALPLTNLPARLPQLIGRETEIADVCTLLRQKDVPVVTLTGMGGTGKTRLAIQVAKELLSEFCDGVYFVSLASISDPTLVIASIGQTLGLKDARDRSLFDLLKGFLHAKHLLLVLDNFEQVLDAAPLLTALALDSPQLKFLVTCRGALHIQQEQSFHVSPLSFPRLQELPELEELPRYPAIRLFIERTRAVKPTFQLTDDNAHAIVNICQRLDGLPLSIELAAARMRLLSPQQLLERLDHSLQILTAGIQDVPERQQTLRNAIKWSYDLLNTEEQQLFRWLAAFISGCTIEAAEAVCDAVSNALKNESINVLDAASSLLDKHLLQQQEEEDGTVRLLMLETIREYGLECLQIANEAEIAGCAHAHYYAHWVEECEPDVFDAGERAWFDRLEREYANLRTALHWLMERQAVEQVLSLSGSLVRFWAVRGYVSEGRQWLENALTAGEKVKPAARARALNGAGWLISLQGDFERAASFCKESLALYRELGDVRGTALALHRMALSTPTINNVDAACSLLEESLLLYRKAADKGGIAYSLMALGSMMILHGQESKARPRLEESLELMRETNNQEGIAWALVLLGQVVFRQGDIVRARMLAEEGLVHFKAISNREGIARSLILLGQLLQQQGDISGAYAQFAASLAIFRELGSRRFVAQSLIFLARAAVLQNELPEARALYEECLTLLADMDAKSSIASCLEELGCVIAKQGDFVWATRLWGAAETLYEAIHTTPQRLKQADYEQIVSVARKQLGQKAFAAAWAEGRAMTPWEVLSSRGWTRMASDGHGGPMQPAPMYPAGLSGREVEVLRLVAKGYTNAGIAEQLVISPRTVNAHLRSIYNKLEVTSRIAATRYAMDHRLV